MVKYLIRLDDANQFFDEEKWLRLENIFDDLDIKPIVAVIPNNKDAKLKSKPLNTGFWGIIRRWQNKGWTIALHGFEHQLYAIDKNKSMIPLHNRSEFVGLSLTTQKKKIRKAINICHKNNVFPQVWVAPAHSFDMVTLDALEAETEIRIVSDGISIFPYRIKKFLFIPQQHWSVRRRFFGLWTICLHPETMEEHEFEDLYLRLKHPKIRSNVTKVGDIINTQSKRRFVDQLYSFFFLKQIKLKTTIKSIFSLKSSKKSGNEI